MCDILELRLSSQELLLILYGGYTRVGVAEKPRELLLLVLIVLEAFQVLCSVAMLNLFEAFDVGS